jgi:hypothetical protein
MAVLDSNDTSTNNVIIPLIDPCEDLMSEVVPNPNDTFIHEVIVSKRSRKKKGRAPTVSIIVAPTRINTDVASTTALNRMHTMTPSRAS